MGIDYYSCKSCGETFPDCGEYVYCECDENWCSMECAEEDGFKRGEFEVWNDYYKKYVTQESSCKYCRKEDVEDSALLSTALKLLGVTRADLVKKHFENK